MVSTDDEDNEGQTGGAPQGDKEADQKPSMPFLYIVRVWSIYIGI